MTAARGYYTVAVSFTRPTDTTAYAAGDLVANNTAAASVVPLEWTIPGNVPLDLLAVQLHKSTTTVSNAAFRLHLMSATPVISSAGDNSALTTVAAGSANILQAYEGTLVSGFNDGVVGKLTPCEGIIMPIFKAPSAGAPTKLYGLLEARAAYAPGNAEVFTATLIFVCRD